jgi:hypothetical protein
LLAATVADTAWAWVVNMESVAVRVANIAAWVSAAKPAI